MGKILDTISSGPEIVFEYIKGNENSIADFLSRYLISDKGRNLIFKRQAGHRRDKHKIKV